MKKEAENAAVQHSAAGQSDQNALLYQREGKLPASLYVPLALQHVVAAIVGIITPAMIVGTACNLPAEDRLLLIQSAMLFSGIVTLLQAFPLFGRIGSGLPVLTGANFAFVPVLNSIGGMYGIAAIIGAQFVAALWQCSSQSS